MHCVVVKLDWQGWPADYPLKIIRSHFKKPVLEFGWSLPTKSVILASKIRKCCIFVLKITKTKSLTLCSKGECFWNFGQVGQVASCDRLFERYQSHPSHVVGVVVALRRVTLTISHQLLVVAWHQVPPLVVRLLVVRVVGGIGVGLVVVVGVAESYKKCEIAAFKISCDAKMSAR